MSLSGRSCPLEEGVFCSDTGIDPNQDVATMPEVLSQLLDAEQLLNSLVDIPGTFFVEVAAGECIITLGVLVRKLPCMRPWEVLCGKRWTVISEI